MTDDALYEVFGEQQREPRPKPSSGGATPAPIARADEAPAATNRQDWEELKAESESIMLRIAAVSRSGAAANSEAAMRAV
jgi:hypothetical protein